MKKQNYEAPVMEQMEIKFEENIMSAKANSPANMTTHDASEWGSWE
jgi:hypothetical protein